MAGNALSTHLKIVVGESVVASSAAMLSVMVFEVPVWAMFVGWISYFTRGLDLKQGAINLACVLVGVLLGIGAAQGLAVLTPHLGSYALAVIVFAITVVALSLAKAPMLNNVLGFFLGLVAYFASHQPPSLATFRMLAVAAALGAIAGFLAHALQKRMAQRSPH